MQSAAYTNAAAGWTTGVINTVTGSFTSSTGSIVLTALRFGDATGRTVTENTTTLTVGGILVASGAGTSVLNGSGFIRVNAASSLNNNDFNVVQNSSNDFTIGANIANGTSSRTIQLVKSGTGRLILTNTGNGYTSGTSVLSGVLSISNNGNLGPAATAAVVSLNGGALESTSSIALDNGVNFRPISLLSTGGLYAAATATLTVSGVVSGAGGVNINPTDGTYTSNGNTITNTGTVLLSGANTYTGTTTVAAGTVSTAADNNLGASAAAVVLNGGTLTTTAFITGTHAITVGASGGTINVNASQYYLNTRNRLVGSGTLTVIGGSGTLVANVGNLRLDQANSYSGNMIVQNGGSFEYGAQGAVGAAATFNVNSNGEFVLQGFAATTLPTTNTIAVNGGVVSFENGNLGSFANPIPLGAGGATIALRDWYNYAAARSGAITGAISGSGYLSVNQGSGTGGVLTLSGTNTYNGTTTISSGKVLVNGTHAGGAAYAVNSGGSLGGNGLISTAGNAGVAVASGGKLVPGVLAGTLTMNLGTGTLDISDAVGTTNSQALQYDLGSVASSDKIDVTAGTLTIGSGTLEFDDFAFNDLYSVDANSTYTLIATNSAVVGSLGSNVTGTINGVISASIGLSGDGTDLVLNVTAAPEPTSLGLIGLGTGALLSRRRRKVSSN